MKEVLSSAIFISSSIILIILLSGISAVLLNLDLPAPADYMIKDSVRFLWKAIGTLFGLITIYLILEYTVNYLTKKT